jgi:hypothetical protein
MEKAQQEGLQFMGLYHKFVDKKQCSRLSINGSGSILNPDGRK